MIAFYVFENIKSLFFHVFIHSFNAYLLNAHKCSVQSVMEAVEETNSLPSRCSQFRVSGQMLKLWDVYAGG